MANEWLDFLWDCRRVGALNPRALHARLLVMLCAFAFALMQGFGSGKLYLCSCSDVPNFTSAPACAVEQGADCHLGDAGDAGDSEQPHHEDHEHISARDDVNSAVHGKVSVPAAPLISVLPEARLDFEAQNALHDLRARYGGDSPPWVSALTVSRSVVFLI